MFDVVRFVVTAIMYRLKFEARTYQAKEQFALNRSIPLLPSPYEK